MRLEEFRPAAIGLSAWNLTGSVPMILANLLYIFFAQLIGFLFTLLGNSM
ncbi:MAG: hypothetical protein J5J06_13940 [Phycisphaerae bacterium]|nr:hypothetical protein [Phycisphaerae bacterium]